MTINEQWDKLLSEGNNQDWKIQLSIPIKGHSIYTGINGLRRALLIRIPDRIDNLNNKLPACKELECKSIQLGDHLYIAVILIESRYCDIFAALAEDLVRRLKGKNGDEDIKVFLSQLARWQKFLAVNSSGLSSESQRGLWGELYFLINVIFKNINISYLESWKGPYNAPQDFQFKDLAIEVKTTNAQRPQSIKIANERQLDDTVFTKIYLHVYMLETIESKTATLPQLISTIRDIIKNDFKLSEYFDDSLIEVGYFDKDEIKYSNTSYIIRDYKSYSVGKEFPRIIEKELHFGIGNVSYELSLSACSDFIVEADQIRQQLLKL